MREGQCICGEAGKGDNNLKKRGERDEMCLKYKERDLRPYFWHLKVTLLLNGDT